VSLDWDFLRIATFYGPVWVVIIATFAIYVCAGLVVFKWRDQLIHMAHNHVMSAADTTVDEQELSPVEPTMKVTVQKNNLGVWVASPEDTSPPNEHNLQEKRPTHLSPTPTTPHRNEYRSQSTVSNRELPTTAQANRAALNYCKCAVLFFIALLVTWVPSTINRVYSLVHPDSVVFGLDFASGLVLPLQGFWNAVVYIATGFPACQALVGKMRDAIAGGGGRSDRNGSTSPQGKENNLKTSRNCLSRRTESTENLTDT
jgi:hypothetical protein